MDDASTDELTDIAQKYVVKDSQIKLLSSETNQGVAATRNMGIRQARDEYLYFFGQR